MQRQPTLPEPLPQIGCFRSLRRRCETVQIDDVQLESSIRDRLPSGIPNQIYPATQWTEEKFMQEQDSSTSLVIDASAGPLPFDHGTRITINATDTHAPGSLLSIFGAVADRLGARMHGEILVLTEAKGFERELRGVGLLGFWNDAGADREALVIAKLRLALTADTTAATFGRLRAKATSEAELTVVTPSPSLSPRAVVIERLAQAIRLPHMVDQPLVRGQVIRLEHDAALSLDVAMSDRLAISVQRPGRSLSLRRSVSVRGGGRVAASAQTRMSVDVRSASNEGDVQVEIRTKNAAAVSLGATADIRASSAISGLPRNTREIAAALLEELGDAAEPVIDELEDMAPDLFETLDEMLARAGAFQARAALEAALQRSVTHTNLATVVVSLPGPGAETLRRLASGDLSVLFEEPEGLISAKGTLRDELHRRATLQLMLSLPRSSTRLSNRRSFVTALIRQLRLRDDGTLYVDLTNEARVEHTRTRFSETLRTLFTLSAGGSAEGLGEGVTAPSLRTIRWTIAVTDEHTQPEELAAYFRRVHALGFQPVEGWFSLSEMPRDESGGYGQTSISLDLRFSPARLLSALAATTAGEDIRESLRRAILVGAHASRRAHLIEIAWAYWTGGTHALWHASRRRDAQAFTRGGVMRIAPIRPGPVEEFGTPRDVRLNAPQRRLLERLYLVEEEVVAALRDLHTMLSQEHADRGGVWKRIDALGGAFSALEAASAAPESLFYVLDRLAPVDGADASAAALTVSSRIGDIGWRKRVRLQRMV